MLENFPKNIEEKDIPLFDIKLAPMPKHEVQEMKDVYFNSDNLLFKDGRVLRESFTNGSLADRDKISFVKAIKGHIGIKTFLKDPFLIKSRLFKKKIVINEPCLIATDTWSIGYFHWLMDVLPRLLAAEYLLDKTTLILPKKYQKRDYIVSSLKIFNIKNIHWVEENEVLLIKKLFLSNHFSRSGHFDEKTVLEISKRIKDLYKNEKKLNLGENIYISRGKAQRRKIANEEEIMPILEKYGFKKVYLEDYPWKDQISICQNAKNIISNHGAGLTNVIFMEAGGNVLELGYDKKLVFCYFYLSQKIKINFYYKICKPRKKIFQKTNETDIIVNNNIEELIAKI